MIAIVPKERHLLIASLPFFVLLLASLMAGLARGDDNCYINDSGFTCCSKSLGR
jgi:hypothetical protein